jgi:hypothetical protein
VTFFIQEEIVESQFQLRINGITITHIEQPKPKVSHATQITQEG